MTDPEQLTMADVRRELAHLLCELFGTGGFNNGYRMVEADAVLAMLQSKSLVICVDKQCEYGHWRYVPIEENETP